MTTVRPYHPDDLAAIRDVCIRTADGGKDATPKAKHPDLMSDLYAVPYTVHDPDLCFVVDDGEAVVGYIVACADTPAYAQWFRETWFPEIAGKYPQPDENPHGWDQFWIWILHYSYLKEPVPEVADHPAHMHLNLIPEYQHKGLGPELMTALLAALRAAGVPALHVTVGASNEQGIAFYRRWGFEPLTVPDESPVVWLGRAI